jgi:hypothetical protein
LVPAEEDIPSMKHLPVILTVPAILVLSLVFRAEPRGPEGAGPAAASDTSAGAGESSHETPAAGTVNPPAKGQSRTAAEELQAARVALGCGTCLLAKAREVEGGTAVALLELAVQQFRACLSFEADTPAARDLFADARHQLGQAKDLLARAGHPEPAAEPPPQARESVVRKDRDDAPRSSELLPAPQPSRPPAASPAPAVRTPVSAKPTEPLMVGPDGVIYRRAGTSGR